jgi:3-dehydroquinate dehydratase type I
MICIPIMARTTASALREMSRCWGLAELVELRIDQMAEIRLENLMSEKRGRVLVTNRRSEEGGGFSGPEAERIRLLRDAVALGADYVDVEVNSASRQIRGLRKEVEMRRGGAQLIVSHHDRDGTPSARALRKTLAACESAGAHIVKIVTQAHSVEDNLRVLDLIPFARARGGEIIAFCMGEMGRASRAIAPLLGSRISFATREKGRESAPGQFTLEEMRLILGILRGDQ